MNQEYELIPGAKFKPLFSSEEEYEKFRERYQKAMFPILEEQRLARAKSIQDAFHHYVD
jgi:hypothetical protein